MGRGEEAFVFEKFTSLLNFDPRKKEGITNITIWLALVAYFLFIHLFVAPFSIDIAKENSFLYLFVLFVPSAVKLLIFSGDSLAQGKNKEAAFFQKQFPDQFIADRFSIQKSMAQHLWFRSLDRRDDEGEVQRTYQYGYTCRLVYYSKRISALFGFAGVAFLLINSAINYVENVVGAGDPWWLHIGYSFAAVRNWQGKAFYCAHLLLLLGYLQLANRVSKPSGVWARWEQINNRNKAWLQQFKTVEELKAFAYSEPPASAVPPQPTEAPPPGKQ
jgi:hypothetical protein